MLMTTKRRLVMFYGVLAPIIDACALLTISIFFLRFLPTAVFSANPATGGDMGSHYWPLVTLVKHGLPEGLVRVWNPGNLGGEPHLVNYFPLPYFVMAFLSLGMPLGEAFNIGTLLPLLTLPIAIYCGLRMWGLRFPAPIIAATSSLCFMYNESFSMWGGNTLSTLAGQFAHGYALSFLFFALGALLWEYRTKRFPLWSSLFFAAVITSHAYVTVGIPLFFLGILAKERKDLLSITKHLITSGVLATLLTLWFTIPLVTNSPWTTPFFVVWRSPTIVREVAPLILYPVIAIVIVALLSLFHPRLSSGTRRIFYQTLYVWGVPTLGYLVYYFLFPKVGLVDIRAFPQVQLFSCVVAGIFLGVTVRNTRIAALFAPFVILVATLLWIDPKITNFPSWLLWNYSGWTKKPAYPDLMALTDRIRGNFSQPRVVYEHNILNNSTGTERVFEMLPFFANRATLESVYLQASILAPAAFLTQSLVSKTPSCPFVQYDCSPYDLEHIELQLKLLGVGELILITPELKEQAARSAYLVPDGDFGRWSLVRLSEQPSLIETFTKPPLLASNDYWKNKYTKPAPLELREKGVEKVAVDPSDWRDLFYAWFKNYSPAEPMIVLAPVASAGDLARLPVQPSAADGPWSAPASCKPELKVEFNRMWLKTPCPGYAHFLKFAYNARWKTSSGDDLFLVSPGFIGLIPSQPEVEISFGASSLWSAAGIVSVITFTCMGLAMLMGHLKKKIK